MRQNKTKIIMAALVSPLIAPFILAPLFFFEWTYRLSHRLPDVTFKDLVNKFMVVAQFSIPISYIVLFLIGMPLTIAIKIIFENLPTKVFYFESFLIGFILYSVFIAYFPGAVSNYYFALCWGGATLGIGVFFNQIVRITNR
jgi:hypothetical protein